MSDVQARFKEMARKSAETRATGVARPSRAKALRAYYRDLAGVDTCVGPDKRGAIDEYKANVAAAKGKPLVSLIQSICFECVGAGADAGPKLRVRDCQVKDCPLYAVRPWQKVKGAMAPDIAFQISKLNTQ